MKPVLSPKDYRSLIDTVVAAGERLMEVNNAVVKVKGMSHETLDLVTQADLDSEEFLQNRLTKRFPSFGFYSEETAKESKRELDKELYWVVDPLDGTLQFSRNLPFFGVSVGLMRFGKPVAGFIYLPVLKQLFHAQQNQGAFFGNKKIHVSKRPHPEQSMGVLSYTGITDNQQRMLHGVFIRENVIMLRIGSAILQLGYTASGKYDLYVGINQALWDLAAGWAIIEEAGGTVDVWLDEKKKAAGNFYHVSFIASRGDIVRRLSPKLRSL